jgi:two-component system nitrogen regulation sensor histidine kinase GlnL
MVDMAINLGISGEAAAMLNRLAAGIAVLDGESRFVHVNAAFVELTGLARWRGYPLAVLGQKAAELETLVARVQGGETMLVLRGWELPARDPSLRVDVALSAWEGRGVLLELHDLASHEVALSAPRLSHSLRGLAHEVKNPLAGLRGAAQLLKRRAAEPDQQQLAELIIAEADRLAALTDRLLHAGGKPHLSVVNVHEVAERARALIASETAAELRFDRDYDPSLPALRGDADRLLQLLLNLLRNALQAHAKSILVRTRAEHAALVDGQPVRLALRLEVIDDGEGVPATLHDTLFLPLVSGRSDGTGLGLALAQEVAHEHGGRITFTSRPGRTVFSLMLPLENTHA